MLSVSGFLCPITITRGARSAAGGAEGAPPTTGSSADSIRFNRSETRVPKIQRLLFDTVLGRPEIGAPWFGGSEHKGTKTQRTQRTQRIQENESKDFYCTEAVPD